MASFLVKSWVFWTNSFFYYELYTSPIFEKLLDSYFLLGLKSAVIVSHPSFIVFLFLFSVQRAELHFVVVCLSFVVVSL